MKWSRIVSIFSKRVTRPLMMVLLLAVCGLAAGDFTAGVQPVLAAGTVTVDRTDDTAAASACTAAANDCSLRGAVIFANLNPGTTINIPAGIYSLTIDGSAESGFCTNPAIGDLDIAGNNTSIVGAGPAATIIQQTTLHDRVICVDQNLVGNFTFSISGVTVLGGRETFGVGGGGIISGAPGDVTNVANVIFSNNQATGSGSPDGGGLGNGAGALNISNSSFIGNLAAGSGGGLYYSNNNLANGQTLSLINSTFTNNISTGGDGGAVKTTSTASPYTISGSTFNGNLAQGTFSTGGAVANESGTLNIDHSTFTNNQVTQSGGRGGALGSTDGSGHNLNVHYSRFVGNTAVTPANGSVLYTGAGSTTSATENWWGCNGGPNTTGCGTIANGAAGVTNFNPWIVLSVTATTSPIQVNGSTILTASFLKDSSGAALTPAQVSQLVALPVGWGSPVRGSLSNLQTVIQSSGTATALFVANAAGAGSASATVDNATASGSVTITKADTTTLLITDTPDPSVTGQPVMVSYSVSGSPSGVILPTGNVTVSDGTNSCTGTIAAGSCLITFTSAGAKSLKAVYAGDGNFNGSTSAAETHQVNKADTTTTITTHTPDPSILGAQVTVTFMVAVNSPGGGIPTGNVTVSDGVNSCTGTVASGTCLINLNTFGLRTLTATYTGDDNYNGSTSTGNSHVVKGLFDIFLPVISNAGQPALSFATNDYNSSQTGKLPGSISPQLNSGVIKVK